MYQMNYVPVKLASLKSGILERRCVGRFDLHTVMAGSHYDLGLCDRGADRLVGQDLAPVDVHFVLHRHVLAKHAHVLHAHPPTHTAPAILHNLIYCFLKSFMPSGFSLLLHTIDTVGIFFLRGGGQGLNYRHGFESRFGRESSCKPKSRYTGCSLKQPSMLIFTIKKLFKMPEADFLV